jgi:hypothetical protein
MRAGRMFEEKREAVMAIEAGFSFDSGYAANSSSAT